MGPDIPLPCKSQDKKEEEKYREIQNCLSVKTLSWDVYMGEEKQASQANIWARKPITQ